MFTCHMRTVLGCAAMLQRFQVESNKVKDSSLIAAFASDRLEYSTIRSRVPSRLDELENGIVVDINRRRVADCSVQAQNDATRSDFTLNFSRKSSVSLENLKTLRKHRNGLHDHE